MADVVAKDEAKKENVLNNSETMINPKSKEPVPSVIDNTTPKWKEPLAFCDFVTKRPKLSFCLTLLGHFFLLILTFLLRAWGYDILPIDFNGVPLNLESDATKIRFDVWKNVREDPRLTLDPTMVGEAKERMVLMDILELVYHTQNGNIFTTENLRLIEKQENEFFDKKIFREICYLQNALNCTPTVSIIRFFDGSYKKLNPVFYDPSFQNIPAVLWAAYSNNKTRHKLLYHLHKDAKITPTSASSAASRSRMLFGYPLEGFNGTSDRQTEQRDKLTTILEDNFLNELDALYENGLGEFKVAYYCGSLFGSALMGQVMIDLSLAVGSLCFIFCFMWFQTRSLWITSWAVFSIICCFFGANLIYRIVFDFRYIGIFHVLSVFIILGIGADDVFVFYDTWRQMQKVDFPSLSIRLSEVYRRAASAMFITSITTMVAFLSSFSSSLLALKSFGLFSALLVFVNYCSVIIFFPTVVINYHLSWKDWTWPCCRPCSKQDEIQVQPTEEDTQKKENIVVLFFYNVYSKKVALHPVVKWIGLAFFVVLVGVMIGFSTDLGADERQIELWRPGTNGYDHKDITSKQFMASQEDPIVKVHMIWGLKYQDRSSCHLTDYKCTGTTVFDDSFDMNPPPCQIAMLDFCKKLRLQDSTTEKLKIRKSVTTEEAEVLCFIEEMDRFFKEEGKKAKYPNNTDLSLPINAKKIEILMKYNPDVYNTSSVEKIYYRYFENALAFWLSRGGKSTSHYEYLTFSPFLGGAKDLKDNGPSSIKGSNYGNRLLIAAVATNLSLIRTTLGYDAGLPVYDEWEEFMNEQMKSMPPSCQHGFQATVTGGNIWHWLKVQKELVVTAVRGIIIGLLLALIILTIATANWIVSTIASLTIAFITLTVLGFIPMVGWKLGILESLNLTLVVGLAVDYVVHLADGYIIAPYQGRQERVRDMLGHVGVSVLSGSCTTLGASIFMLAAKITFFFQFGIFVFSTIGFSILYALGFYSIVMGLIGPQGQNGSLHPIYMWIWDKIRGKKKTDKACSHCKGKGFHTNDTLVIENEMVVYDRS